MYEKLFDSSQDSFIKSLKTETNVSGLLQDLKHSLYADRLLILQYHNGTYSIASNHLAKVTATHEALSSDVPSLVTSISSWPASFFGNFNESLVNHNCIEIPSLPVLLDDTDPGAAVVRGLYSYLAANGVRSMYLFPLANSYGKVFGFAMLHYVNKSHTLSGKELELASTRFSAIGHLLAGLSK
jgi:hypothetical protein